MFALRVVDQRDRGLGHCGQIGNFTRMVHAQLNHADLVAGTQTQQGQRYTNVVVEIALGRKSRVLLPGAQDGRNHLRDRGFTVAARHRNQRQAKAGAPCGGKLTQRQF